MLPDDWGDSTAGPRDFHLPGDWPALISRYAGLGKSPSLEAAFHVAGGRATRAILELGYIDADYRSEYANFYAQTFRRVPDRSERVHFFDEEGEIYLGFVVLRPIRGRPLCRTILAPPEALARHVSCQAQAIASPYGYRLAVTGFPFISQDYQYGVCAHAAIWMIALYHHLAFARPRYFVSDIVRAAGSYQDRLRLTPSEGLSFPQIVAVLHELGMPPATYLLEELSVDEVAAVASRYLNSRLPVLLLTEDHATVLVGHGIDDADGRPFFIRHDDAAGPYETKSFEHLKEWKHLLVPLPGRIYITAEAAEEAGRFVIDNELRYRTELAQQQRALERGETRFKTYVAPIAEYKRQLRSRALPPEVVAWHSNVSTSNWVWVVELQDRAAANSGRRCVIGEVVVDATSDKLWPNPLFANLPGTLLRFNDEGGQFHRSSPQDALYDSAAALHP